MYATSPFGRTYIWELIQHTDDELPERVKALNRSTTPSTRHYKTEPSPRSPILDPSHPFRTQPRATDFQKAMRDEKYKWWNTPPKTDWKSETEATKCRKLELHVPSVEAFNVEVPFLSPSHDCLRSFRGYPLPWEPHIATSTMAERERLFRQYNHRPRKPVEKYDSHYLDHSAEAKKPGKHPKDKSKQEKFSERKSHVVTKEGEWNCKVELEEYFTLCWMLFWSLLTWIGVSFGVIGTLFWRMDSVVKPVLTFTFFRRAAGSAIASTFFILLLVLLAG